MHVSVSVWCRMNHEEAFASLLTTRPPRNYATMFDLQKINIGQIFPCEIIEFFFDSIRVHVFHSIINLIERNIIEISS
jgi:hypothetical protein